MPQKEYQANVSFNNIVKVEFVEKYIKDMNSDSSNSSMDLNIQPLFSQTEPRQLVSALKPTLSQQRERKLK